MSYRYPLVRDPTRALPSAFTLQKNVETLDEHQRRLRRMGVRPLNLEEAFACNYPIEEIRREWPDAVMGPGA